MDLSINMKKKSLKTCGSKHKHENEPKNMSKHKHEKLTYPNPRRVVQQHQSDKSWQKANRHARKLKHAGKSK